MVIENFQGFVAFRPTLGVVCFLGWRPIDSKQNVRAAFWGKVSREACSLDWVFPAKRSLRAPFGQSSPLQGDAREGRRAVLCQGSLRWGAGEEFSQAGGRRARGRAGVPCGGAPRDGAAVGCGGPEGHFQPEGFPHSFRGVEQLITQGHSVNYQGRYNQGCRSARTKWAVQRYWKCKSHEHRAHLHNRS